jgi:tetratricopeptide (TPR) repeat protein
MVDVSQLYRKAEETFNRQNFDYAIELFFQIIQLDPNHKEARIALRTVILRKYERQGYPSKIKLGILSSKTLAELQLHKGKPAKCVEIAQKYLLQDPNNTKVRTALAQALKDTGYIDGALSEAQIAVECDRNYVAALKLLGQLYKEKGMVKEAQEVLNRVVALHPDDRATEKILRDLAAIETMKKGIEEAKSYRDLIDKEKAEELESAHRLMKTEDEVEKEVRKYMTLLQQNPNDLKTIKKLADIYGEIKKDYRTSAQWWKKACELVPQDSFLRDKYEDCWIKIYEGQILAAQKNNDKQRYNELRVKKLVYEIKSYERRAGDRPTDTQVRFDLGRRYYAAGSNYIDKAIREFQQSVRDPKRRVDSHIFLGQCFQKKKLYDLADEQYAKAEEAGLVTQEKQLYIWYNRAVCAAEYGDYQKAIDYGKKIMQVDISYKNISELVQGWQSKAK